LRVVEVTAKVELNLADVFTIYIMYVRNIYMQAKLIMSELVSILKSALQSELFVWILQYICNENENSEYEFIIVPG